MQSETSKCKNHLGRIEVLFALVAVEVDGKMNGKRKREGEVEERGKQEEAQLRTPREALAEAAGIARVAQVGGADSRLGTLEGSILDV